MCVLLAGLIGNGGLRCGFDMGMFFAWWVCSMCVCFLLGGFDGGGDGGGFFFFFWLWFMVVGGCGVDVDVDVVVVGWMWRFLFSFSFFFVSCGMHGWRFVVVVV